MHTILILFLSASIITCGDVLMKFWVVNGKSTFYIAALCVYVIGLMFFAETLKRENIAVASAILVMFNVTTLVLVGWLFFHEPYSHTKLAGIVMAMCSVALLEIGS